MDRIRHFIDKLSREVSTPELTNVYSPEIPQSEVCRENLYNYLQRIRNNNSNVMLIGEAPGYHGCRLSGIAFTCEENFTEDIIPEIMGKDLGYKIYSDGKSEREFSDCRVPEKQHPLFTLFKFVNFEHFTPIFTLENPLTSPVSGFSMFIFNILRFQKNHASLCVINLRNG